MKPFSLRRFALLVLRVGNLTFGGGDPTMSVLHRELVVSREWITPEQYGLAYSLARATPGTNLLAFCAGVGWILAATYVFFRDLTPILAFLLGVVFYLSPILYPVAGRFERIFIWNPMTPLLGLFRSAMLSAALPAAGSIVFLLVVAIALFTGGLLFFRRAQGTLADLI